jgi:hypothetical protein
VNHTRFPKEDLLPDRARWDNQVKKGGWIYHVSSSFVSWNFLSVRLIIQCDTINPPCPYSAKHFGVRCTRRSLVSRLFLTQILEIEGLCSYCQISSTSCMRVWDIISLDFLCETREYVFSSYIAYYDLSHITWTQKIVLLFILRWNSGSLCLLHLLDIYKDLNERLTHCESW